MSHRCKQSSGHANAKGKLVHRNKIDVNSPHVIVFVINSGSYRFNIRQPPTCLETRRAHRTKIGASYNKAVQLLYPIMFPVW